MVTLKRAPVRFYRTASGKEPVREWLLGLPKKERKVVGEDLQRLEYRWPVGMPLARTLGKGLEELRSNLPGGRTARVVFMVVGRHLILLHGFIKKTKKTPKADLDLALKRKKDWEKNNGKF